MLDFESRRVFSEDFERNILLNLEVLSVLKSRLDSIQESGALSGSLKNLEMRLRELKVRKCSESLLVSYCFVDR